MRNGLPRILSLSALGLSFALAVRFVLSGAALAEGGAQESEFGILFEAPGVESTWYACTACHSEMIVAQQGLTRAEWDEMLEWMVEEHGMYEIEEPERTEILDYLAEHYNVDRPNFPVLRDGGTEGVERLGRGEAAE